MYHVLPMSRDEMLERLHRGEDPWEIVFDKWERLKILCKTQNVEKLDLIEYAYGSTCALCEIHSIEDRSSICCFGDQYGLLPCPLVQIGQRCGGNAWNIFSDNPSEHSAQLMIDTLKRARGDIEQNDIDEKEVDYGKNVYR